MQNENEPQRDYTVEVRVDVQCVDDDHARQLAQEIAEQVGGRVTAVFDVDWDELEL